MMQCNFLSNSLLHILSSTTKSTNVFLRNIVYRFDGKNDDDVNSSIYGRMAVILFPAEEMYSTICRIGRRSL